VVHIFYGGLKGAQIPVYLVAFVLAALIAIILHEIAHAWAAYKSGDPSAKIAGRLSLNPAKHLDPMGTLCIVVTGMFGWAKPVPVNPFNYRNFRKGNFFVSIAGVTVNLILAFLFSLFYFLVIEYAFPTSSIWLWGLAQFFALMVVINIALFIFNLLPVYPLDGYNLLVSFTKPTNRYMNFMRRNSSYMLPVILIILIVPLIGGQSLLGFARNGIIDGFIWFWGLMF